MLSGTDEPQCREHPSANLLELRSTVSGADAPPRRRWRRPHQLTTRRTRKRQRSWRVPPFTQRSMARPRPDAWPARPRDLEGLLAMDFGIYPPEINSARMYAGPGRDRCSPPRGMGKVGRRTAFGGQLISVGGVRIDRRAVAGPRVSVDGAAAASYARGWSHRRAGRGDRRPGQIRGRRLSDGVLVDGAAADGRRQPQPVDDPGRD